MYAPYKLFDFTLLAPKVEPRTFTPDLDGLIAWLEMQDGATEYDVYDSKKCLFARFHSAIGQPIHLTLCAYDRYYGKNATYDLANVDREARTLGAALTRARNFRARLQSQKESDGEE